MVISSVHDVLENFWVADVVGSDQSQLRVVVVYIAIGVFVLTPRIRYTGTIQPSVSIGHREYYRSYYFTSVLHFQTSMARKVHYIGSSL